MPDAKPKIDPTRQMLMRIGGTFTILMARAGFTPEAVSQAGMNYISVDEMHKIMVGADVDVPVSKLAFLAGQLNVPLVLGVNMPPQSGPDSSHPTTVSTSADPDHT